MADEIPDSEKPITVDPSVPAALILTGFRQVALVIAGCGTIVTFLAHGDAVGLVAWIKGSEFTQFISTTVALVTLIYGQYQAYRRKRESVTIAHAAPDTVAIVRQGWLSRLLTAIGRKFTVWGSASAGK